VLADNAADIIWRLDSEGRIDYISPADERLRGYAPEDVIGLRFEQLLHPDYAEVLELAHAHRLEQENNGIKTGDLAFELPLVCKGGGTIWADILSTPLRGNQDEIVGYIGVARDITERRKLSEERENLVAELQDALAKIKTLSGMLPICATCKKIRDDKGYWNILEAYISKHSDVSFSHGICPECAKKTYEQIEHLEKTEK
jgi:PAS domain S-box-containing protein